MSELKPSSPNDTAPKKSLPVPRSTKTSRAREIFLQKQASATPSVSTTAPSTPKVVTAKAKVFKATPTPSYLGKKISTKAAASSSKNKPESPSKDDRNEVKPLNQQHTLQGDMADEEFEIVQLHEIKENPSGSEDVSKESITHALQQDIVGSASPRSVYKEESFTSSIATPRSISEKFKTNSQNTSPEEHEPSNVNNNEVEDPIIEEDINLLQNTKSEYFETRTITDTNPCDAPIINTDKLIIAELECKLSDREKDIIRLEEMLKEATNKINEIDEEYTNHLNDLNQRLEDTNQKLTKSIEECNLHRDWVQTAENQLNLMKFKFFESEKKMVAQEDDLRNLLRWSNIKNASIVTFAATALAYYHSNK